MTLACSSDHEKQHDGTRPDQAWAGGLIQVSVRKPMQASGCGLGVQRVKLAGRGLSLLLGGLHPNVRHLQPHMRAVRSSYPAGIYSLSHAHLPAVMDGHMCTTETSQACCQADWL